MDKDIYVRPVKISDAQQLIEIIPMIDTQTPFMVRSEGEFNLTLEQEIEFISSKLNAKNYLFLVAILNDTIVGTLGFNGSTLKKYKHFGEFGMGVLKDYWGNGAGSLLLQSLIDWTKENQILKINLKIVSSNQRAIRLYEKFGFIYEGTIVAGVFIDGKYEDLVIIALPTHIESEGQVKVSISTCLRSKKVLITSGNALWAKRYKKFVAL